MSKIEDYLKNKNIWGVKNRATPFLFKYWKKWIKSNFTTTLGI